MGIRFLCPTCGKRINVKEQQAGLRGFCPKCGAGVDIPLESTIPSRSDQEESTMAVARTARANAAAATQAQSVVDPLYELPTALWYALPPGAPKPYGPIDGPGLAQWFYEGRLSPDSMVWREDWPEWRQVAAVWPNWSPGGTGLAGEPMIDPPADGSSYKLKAVKAQSVTQPPVMVSKAGAPGGGGSTSRGLTGTVAPTLGGGKGTQAVATATPVGSATAGGGVYYRRRTNRSYLTTVVVLILLVLALGGVMIWVIVRDPPPPTKKTDTTNPTVTKPLPVETPAPTTQPVSTSATKPATTGS